MTLQVQRRDVYGHIRIYPINDAAKLLVRLTGRRTLYPADLQVAELLGFKIEWIPMTVDVGVTSGCE